MARMPRADSFLCESARLTEDDLTIQLTLEQWGAYSRIFLRAWHQPEHPGVIPASDHVLASMAGLPPQAGASWPAIRAAIEPLFDTTSRPGYWIAHGLVEVHEVQTEYLEKQRVKGIASGKARRVKRSNRGSGSVGTEREPIQGSRFSVLGKEEPNPLGQTAAPTDREPVVQLPLDPEDPDRVETPQEWAAGFPELWHEYPRHVKRAEALKAYMRLTRTQREYDRIFRGLEHWKRGEWANRPADKIEHCSTWLNNRRYMDAETEGK